MSASPSKKNQDLLARLMILHEQLSSDNITPDEAEKLLNQIIKENFKVNYKDSLNGMDEILRAIIDKLLIFIMYVIDQVNFPFLLLL